MGNLDYPRTTLFVIDRDTWVRSKGQAELLGYSSVSEYIFSLLQSDLERKISLQMLLRELEKYYELDFYTLGFVAEKTFLPLRTLIYLMRELKLPLPEEKSFSNMQRIHEELIKNNLLPREVESILNLKNRFGKNQILDNANMLIALFPDEIERTAEVLSITREILLDIIDSEKLEEYCANCENFDDSKYSDLRRVFSELALKYDDEVLSDDPILNKLKEYKSSNLFGRFVEFSAVLLIKRELQRINEFRLGQIIEIPMPEIKAQEERIDQEKERLKAELKVYLKNIAFVDRL